MDTCACIFYVSDNVMTRVHLANNILLHIIMLLFKSHPVYCQLKNSFHYLFNQLIMTLFICMCMGHDFSPLVKNIRAN